ncbi:hypothetical protein [Microbacterium kunmingense]|uniref:hypothetical protein n=1 Tax=Microbacterium kunmingense TaxID=2915939 RepID=UPI002005AE0A|nr:hypothetical protein [Microbacterium kunmingense]
MWLYQLPVGVALPGFVILFVAASMLIVIALRRWVPGEKKQMREWDRILAYVMATFGVLYGVTLALIAAASAAPTDRRRRSCSSRTVATAPICAMLT